MDPTPHSHESNHDRTAEWVVAQANESYESLPPSPVLAMTTMGHAPSSNRTTASSEQSLASSVSRRRHTHSSSSHLNPLPNYSTSVPPHTTREQMRLPFPQSPPGSGYPLMLQVVPPRAEPDRSQPKPARPSLVKKRRPSLIDQIKAFGTPSGQSKRDDGRR